MKSKVGCEGGPPRETRLKSDYMSVRHRTRTGNMPAVTDEFVGRDAELDRIIGLLRRSARLITLTGAGGIGKTRLASEAVRRIYRAEEVPVFWVRLARLTKDASPTAVEEEIATTIIGLDLSGRPGWDALVDRLNTPPDSGRDQVILVLDNCEHVLDGAARVIADLLEAVPRVSILATSRAPIGWLDEYVVKVPSLSQGQALALFRHRAQFTGNTIAGKEELAKANSICRHVHHNPLYIRLAAARLLRQPLTSIIDDLSGAHTDKRMRWTHGPRVGAEPRHKGVRDVIAWSYDLCLDQERLLLDRMSVFAAGYDANPDDVVSPPDVGVDLEAIEAVCADGPRDAKAIEDEPTALPPEDVEDVLERLVDQSLVTAHLTPTTVRYSLLESVRVFAARQLQERSDTEMGAPARFTRRHRWYYRDKIVAARADWFGPSERNLITWVRGARDNLVSAIETSLVSNDPTTGLEIAICLSDMRNIVGSPREMRRWTIHALEAVRTHAPETTDLHIDAVAVIGWLDLIQAKNDEAERMLDESVAAVHDQRIGKDWRQEPETDIGLPPRVEFLWGAELMMLHRDAAAVTVLARAREKFGTLGDRAGEARCSELEAWASCFVGAAPQALGITSRHLAHATAAGAEWATAWAKLACAMAFVKSDSPAEALDLSRDALEFLLRTGDLFGETWAVRIRMWALARVTGDLLTATTADSSRARALATEAAQLAGGISTLRASLGFERGDMGPFTENKALEAVRRVLGREAFTTALRQGSLLNGEQCEIQRLALGTLSVDRLPTDHPARPAVPTRWRKLSATEQKVAIMAAAGGTNAAIAARRGTSTKTIDAQMAAIFRKLVITSRSDIIKVAPPEQVERIRAETAKEMHLTGEKQFRPRPR
ncbi:helix-turn-helix transcriptional regulator [Nocardia sp. NPDC003963]